MIESEPVLINAASGQVSCSREVERIAAFVASWGRKSADREWGCDHRLDQFCEQYGCTSFFELANEIRKRFGNAR